MYDKIIIKKTFNLESFFWNYLWPFHCNKEIHLDNPRPKCIKDFYCRKTKLKIWNNNESVYSIKYYYENIIINPKCGDDDNLFVSYKSYKLIMQTIKEYNKEVCRSMKINASGSYSFI